MIKIKKDQKESSFFTASGRWKNGRWNTQNLGTQWFGSGKTAEIGGNDLYGFEFSDALSDNYNSAGVSVVDSKISFNEVNIDTKEPYKAVSTSRHAASGKGGVIMEITDRIVINASDWYWYTYEYAADSFNMVVNYSSEFENFSGNASTYMHHNYDRATVDSVTIGSTINSDGTVSSEINTVSSMKKYSWSAYSGGNIKF